MSAEYRIEPKNAQILRHVLFHTNVLIFGYLVDKIIRFILLLLQFSQVGCRLLHT
jgi:hypothetical protein